MTQGVRLLCLAALATVPPAYAQFADVPSSAEPDNPYDEATTDPAREYWSPKILQGVKKALPRAASGVEDPSAGVWPSGDFANWPRLYRTDDWLITGSLIGTLALYKMWNNGFDVPPAQAGEGYRTNPGWGEFFLEPALAATYKLNPAFSLYSGVSYVETGTRGHDNVGEANVYHGGTESLYAGLKWHAGDKTSVDLSYGQQDYTVGNGMLVWSGASNGAQRGANYLAPRSAWANAGIAKGTWQDVSAEAFWLKPNDASSAATGTRLTGFNVDWNSGGPVRLGAMYVYVPQSNIETRDALRTFDVRGRWHPFWGSPNLWLEGEYALQRKNNVAGNGWYLQGTYNAVDVPWKPLFALRYAALSGDRGGTSKWEGFDPLYFGNSDPNWYQGYIGSTLFANTNLNTASITVTLNPTSKQILEFYYFNFAANRTNAPLAVPAPNTSPTGGGGVPTKALANEFDVAYTYTISAKVNIGAVVGYAAPLSGLKELYAADGGAARGWWFFGTQVNISY